MNLNLRTFSSILRLTYIHTISQLKATLGRDSKLICVIFMHLEFLFSSLYYTDIRDVQITSLQFAELNAHSYSDMHDSKKKIEYFQ